MNKKPQLKNKRKDPKGLPELWQITEDNTLLAIHSQHEQDSGHIFSNFQHIRWKSVDNL